MNKQYLINLFNIDDLNIKLKDNISNNKSSIIGELGEKSIHHIIKTTLADACYQEQKIGKYYADIVFNKTNILEIQTSSFNKLRPKLDYYLSDYNVTIVYPLIYKNEIKWINKDTGDVIEGARRTYYSSFNKAFKELYKIKQYLPNKNLNIVILLLQTVEHRYLDGYDKTHKKGATKIDKYPIEFVDCLILSDADDYRWFTRKMEKEYFTVCDYKKINKTNLREAGLAVNILSFLDIIKFDHKDGRKYVYQKNK